MQSRRAEAFFLADHSSLSHHNYRDWQSLIRHGEWTIKTHPVMEKWQNKPAVKPRSYKLLDNTKLITRKTVFPELKRKAPRQISIKNRTKIARTYKRPPRTRGLFHTRHTQQHVTTTRDSLSCQTKSGKQTAATLHSNWLLTLTHSLLTPPVN